MPKSHRCVLGLILAGWFHASSDIVWAQKEPDVKPATGAALPSRVPLKKSSCKVTGDEISGLFDAYADFRKWQTLQCRLAAKIADCTKAAATAEAPYLVTLIRPGENVSVVVPQHERYSANVPNGRKSVYVLLLVDRHVTSETPRDFRLTSSELPNDLVKQLPDAAKAILTAATTGAIGLESLESRDNLFRSRATSGPPQIETVAFASDGPVVLPSSDLSISQTGTLSLLSVGKNEPEDVQVAATFTNQTKRRVEFAGIAAALVGPVAGAEKMKVSDDKYASDPIGRGLTMVALGIHPRAYDSTLHDMTTAERVSVLIGGVLTPAPGLGTGLSIGLARGFGLNVGGALMFVPTAKQGLKPKDEVPSGDNQLRYGWTAGLFFGMAYVFKGGED
jgi:hypothetical protein